MSSQNEVNVRDVLETLGADAPIPPYVYDDDEYSSSVNFEPCPDDWTVLVAEKVNDEGVVSWKRVTSSEASLPCLRSQWLNDWRRRVLAGQPCVKLRAPEAFVRTGRWPKGQETREAE